MKIDELNKLLLIKNVPKEAYSLAGGLPNEAFCLEKLKEGWHVYYSERGNKNTIGKYLHEEEACEALLNKLIKEIIIGGD